VRQLTSVDAQFLALETPRQTGHVGGLAILDPGTTPTGKLELADIQQMLAERLPLLPPLRWRLAEVPFGLDYPYWVDDPDFDLEYHWRQTAIPQPGRREQVEQVISRIASRPLDRSRPLWELYEVQGIDQGDRFGVFTKIHHAAADGAAMMALALATLSMSPEIVTHPRPETVWEPERLPTQLELMAKGLGATVGRPGKTLGWGRRMVRELASSVRQDDGLRSQLPEMFATLRSFKAPTTRFSTMLGPHRRFAYGSTSLEEAKAIRRAFGVTLNDVVLAICAGMLRAWFDERGELPEQGLVAMVPVNTREGEADTSGGNSVSAMAGRLFTDVADPIERLGKISESMGSQKAMQRAVPATVQMEGMDVLAPWAMYQAMRMAYRTRVLPQVAPFNLTISNVPGPPFPVYIDGAQQLGSYPYSTIADGVGLNITVTSYNGQLDWGIVSDRNMVDDLWPMLDGLGKAQSELLNLAG
jgi:diacylglycerol O-acyltransferase / wax synthase